MSEDLLHRILSLKPPFGEVEERSDRARQRALAALDGRVTATVLRRFLPLALASGAGMLVLAALLYAPFQRRLGFPQETTTSGETQTQPVRVYLTLTDGTQVIWVVDDRLRM